MQHFKAQIFPTYFLNNNLITLLQCLYISSLGEYVASKHFECSSIEITVLSARAWCTGKTQRNRVEREVGGGMGNTCKSMADSCQCMTKTTAIL